MGLDRGQLSFLLRPDQAMRFIAVRDMGRVVAAVFGTPDRYAGRTMETAGDALTGRALAYHLTRAADRPISYGRLLTPLLAQGEVLGKLAALVDDGRLAGNAGVDALRAEFPFLPRFDCRLPRPGAASFPSRSEGRGDDECAAHLKGAERTIERRPGRYTWLADQRWSSGVVSGTCSSQFQRARSRSVSYDSLDDAVTFSRWM